MRHKAYMFSRFLLVGGAGFLIDVALTHALITVQLSPWMARIPAIICAMAFTWLANRTFTYGVKDRCSFVEGLRYAFVALFSSVVNYLLFLQFIDNGLSPILSIAVATSLQSVLSFYAYRCFVFAK